MLIELPDMVKTDGAYVGSYSRDAEHGEMGGISDAIGYDIPPHAMKFRTREEAQDYINTKLPEWARDCRKVAELDALDFTWLYWGLTSMIHAYEPIPGRQLQATLGRLRIWRH